MERREFVFALAFGLLATPLAAEAGQTGQKPRIGLLDPVSPSVAAPYHDAFRQGLRQLGYEEGQNIAIEYRFAGGMADPLPQLAAELVRGNLDLIVAGAAAAVDAARRATTTIPIVMVAYGPDPVKAGVVASFARPGGNITGSTLLYPEVNAKRLQLLREAVPRVARVAVLWNPSKAEEWSETEAARLALGVTLQSAAVQPVSGREVCDSLRAKESQHVAEYQERVSVLRLHQIERALELVRPLALAAVTSRPRVQVRLPLCPMPRPRA